MRIAIRADASMAIGSGHVMRCLTLASALRGRGHRVAFFSRPRPGDLFERIAATGFDVIPLPATDGVEHTWLGAGFDQEIAQMRAHLTRSPTDLLVVDQYALGASWEREMRPHAGRIAVIDDLMDRPHECDLLLDQNLRDDAVRPYAGLVPAGAKLLLGPRFALLREEFRAPMQRSRRRSGTIARVLVSMGGFDAQDVTSVVLQGLAHPALAQAVAVDVVLPVAAPHADRVRRRLEGMANARYLGTVEDMAALMERADLAIGGAGTSAWERVALGLPALVITLAANQESGARACQSAGVSVTVGAFGAVQASQVTGAVLALMRDPALVMLMSDRGRAIMRTGEFGTDAVARHLEQLFPGDSTDN